MVPVQVLPCGFPPLPQLALSPGDNTVCSRFQVTCGRGDMGPHPVQIRRASVLLLPSMAEGHKADHKPSFPYTIQRIQKICSCPSIGFHYEGGEKLILNWKDSGPEVIFSNSCSGTFSQHRRDTMSTEQQQLLKAGFFTSYI